MRYFLILGLLFLCFFGKTQVADIHFPEVVLKGVETEATVTLGDAFQDTEAITINGSQVPLVKDEQQVSLRIKLFSDVIEVEEGVSVNKPTVIPGWLALLPPLIAIVLALLFKEVLSSLFIGIFVGAATIGFYTKGVTGILGAFLTVLDHYILNSLVSPDHISVILFSVIIGSVVAIISKNGGMQGVVNRLVKFAKTRRSGMFTTYFLGLAIFFDDYANTLVVGNTMRPITDKLKISREKLAYIVDSTAAPIAAVAFITTWIGAELTYISDGVAKIEATGVSINESAYSIFVNSLAYSFYPIFTLFFVGFIIYKQRDFGPMLTAERSTRTQTNSSLAETSAVEEELKEFTPVSTAKHKAYNAVLPIFFIVTGTFIGLIYTGFLALEEQLLDLHLLKESGVWMSMEQLEGNPTTFFRKLGLVIGNANTYVALLWSSLIGLFSAILLTVSQRVMSLKDTMESLLFGIKTMVPAIVILVLAWSLALVTEDLKTADYLKTFFDKDFETIWMIPALTFVLSAFIAFSTGSSWSTMALMYPLVIPLAFGVASVDVNYDEFAILYNTIASVLAGAVLGDHCSPISDTTILSSLATSCDHISHVKTQMPYALTVGGVALLVGVIPAALGISSLILIPLGIGLLYTVVYFVGRR